MVARPKKKCQNGEKAKALGVREFWWASDPFPSGQPPPRLVSCNSSVVDLINEERGAPCVGEPIRPPRTALGVLGMVSRSTQCPLGVSSQFFFFVVKKWLVVVFGVALRTRPPVWGHSIHAHTSFSPDGGCTRGNTTTPTWDQHGKMAALPCDPVWQRRKAISSGSPVRSGRFDWDHPAECRATARSAAAGRSLT